MMTQIQNVKTMHWYEGSETRQGREGEGSRLISYYTEAANHSFTEQCPAHVPIWSIMGTGRRVCSSSYWFIWFWWFWHSCSRWNIGDSEWHSFMEFDPHTTSSKPLCSVLSIWCQLSLSVLMIECGDSRPGGFSQCLVSLKITIVTQHVSRFTWQRMSHCHVTLW